MTKSELIKELQKNRVDLLLNAKKTSTPDDKESSHNLIVVIDEIIKRLNNATDHTDVSDIAKTVVDELATDDFEFDCEFINNIIKDN